jgi:hypothetical protein
MKKYYFDLDAVKSVILTYESESRYKWFKEIPARSKKFLGLKIGIIPAIPAGWSDYEHGKYPKPSSYFDDYTWYRVDEINKKIWNKAHVEVRFSYKDSTGYNFNSNEEAQAWVDELIMSSHKKFQIIITK